MKSIMLSIKPQWVEKILNGEKTIEIRKTKPSCELPVKVYIYQTKKNFIYKILKWLGLCKGKVVAEFTLNKVDTIEICDPFVFRNNEQENWDWFKENACLDCEEIMSYIGYGSDHDGWGNEYATGYAWHIDNLKIYDKPKELSEFYIETIDDDCCVGCPYHETPIGEEPCKNCYGNRKYITRPPQSYMFVQELEE